MRRLDGGANDEVMHWGGNTQLRRVDSGVAELIVNDGQSYILPLSNYADSVIKYLTSKRALQVRSAVDADGALLPVRRAGAPGWLYHRAGDGAADTGTCRRANNCTANRTGALTAVGDEWRAAGCSGVGV